MYHDIYIYICISSESCGYRIEDFIYTYTDRHKVVHKTRIKPTHENFGCVSKLYSYRLFVCLFSPSVWLGEDENYD